MTREPAHHRKLRLRHASKPPSSVATSPAPVLDLLAWSKPYSADECGRIVALSRAAWHRINFGTGTPDDYEFLAATSNICLVRGESIDLACVQVAQDAQAALRTMRERYDRTGSMATCAATRPPIGDLLDLYEQIVQLSTPLQMSNASQEAALRKVHGDA